MKREEKTRVPFFERLAAFAAALGLIVYALSCRPSFSPDSSMAAFPYNTAEGLCGVAIHDLVGDRTDSVVLFSGRMKESIPQTAWAGDSLMILAVLKPEKPGLEKGKLLVMEYDPATRSFSGIKTLGVEDQPPSPAHPPVVDGKGAIWMAGIEKSGHSLLRIAPGGGGARFLGPAGKTLLIAGGGGRIFYAAMEKGKAPMEIGLLDTSGLETGGDVRLEPLARITEPAEGQSPSLAAAPDGSACAFAAGEAGKNSLYFVKRTGDKATKVIALPESLARVGGVVFSHDCRSLWATGLERQKGKGGGKGTAKGGIRPVLLQLSIEKNGFGVLLRRLLLPVGGKGKEREGGGMGDHDLDLALCLQPDISPDGKHLAISTCLLEKERASRLFLVDLESPDLSLKIIDAPAALEAHRKKHQEKHPKKTVKK